MGKPRKASREEFPSRNKSDQEDVCYGRSIELEDGIDFETVWVTCRIYYEPNDSERFKKVHSFPAEISFSDFVPLACSKYNLSSDVVLSMGPRNLTPAPDTLMGCLYHLYKEPNGLLYVRYRYPRPVWVFFLTCDADSTSSNNSLFSGDLTFAQFQALALAQYNLPADGSLGIGPENIAPLPDTILGDLYQTYKETSGVMSIHFVPMP